tara:strand:+ start:363 stop:764 length:402 start_codon:yes stop_codon:yes gene_type:complete
MKPEKKCLSVQAEHYVNDLFELLEIKGSNQKLFDEFCKLLMRFSEKAVKEAWKEITFSCNLPNGQLAGTIPKLEIIEKILRSKSMITFNESHHKNKKEILTEGTFSKLWQIGTEYAEGSITESELEKKVEQLK